MRGALELIRIEALMQASTGAPEVIIGLIDGPVQASLPALRGANIRTLEGDIGPATCKATASLACAHGTFVAGILAAGREQGVPGLCPGCSFLVRPIFCEQVAGGDPCPEVSALDLACAVVEVVEAGARVLNLSLGLSNTSIRAQPELHEAMDFARRRGALVVVAAGNHGGIGHVPLFVHPWVLPVVACDAGGRFQPGSNTGPSIGRAGLMAPGVDVPGISPAGEGVARMSGTSVAAPFVTGAAALLWSLYPALRVEALRKALLLPGRPRRTIVPPLLDAEASRRLIESGPSAAIH
jgi:subtilisin family serine protease